VRLLTVREAATAFEDALGWPVRPRDVKEAIEQGRLRAEQGSGRRATLLISEEEVARLIEEHRRDDKPLSAEDEARANAWEQLPRGPADIFLGTRWRSVGKRGR
jgi:hypothetical protein